MSMDPQDFIISGASSECCGAAMTHDGICLECGEHCEAQEDEGIRSTENQK